MQRYDSDGNGRGPPLRAGTAAADGTPGAAGPAEALAVLLKDIAIRYKLLILLTMVVFLFY